MILGSSTAAASGGCQIDEWHAEIRSPNVVYWAHHAAVIRMSAPSELTERFRFLELDVKAAFSDAGTQLETFESGAVWLDVHLEGRLFVLHYLDEGFATHYRLGSAGLAEARVQLFGLLGAAQTGPLV